MSHSPNVRIFMEGIMPLLLSNMRSSSSITRHEHHYNDVRPVQIVLRNRDESSMQRQWIFQTYPSYWYCSSCSEVEQDTGGHLNGMVFRIFAIMNNFEGFYYARR